MSRDKETSVANSPISLLKKLYTATWPPPNCGHLTVADETIEIDVL